MNYEYTVTKSILEQHLNEMTLERAVARNLKGLSYWLLVFGF
ncbi:MAG: hypothetical protein K0R29_2343 [Pseudobdellovibrio sp.]|jgi:hypothetical protein|nr:hypothetical protein [Pseudobdellovibrio sp.]